MRNCTTPLLSADMQQQLDKTRKDAEAKGAAVVSLEETLQSLSTEHSNLQHQLHGVEGELQCTKDALNAAQASNKEAQASLDQQAAAHQAQISSSTLAQHQLQDELHTDALTC